MNLTSMIRTRSAAPPARRRDRFRRVPTALALEDRKLLSADPTQYQTIAQTMHFPATATNFDLAETIQGFNPAVGTLTGVDIINNGAITSDAQVENLGSTPATVTATFGGTLTATGPSLDLATPLAPVIQTFDASPYDGTLDYAGTSGKDFGAQTTSGAQSTTLTAHADLVPYLSNNWLTFTESGRASANATADGSLSSNFGTTGSASLTVVYHYIPAAVQAPDNGVLPPLNTASPVVPATPFAPTPVSPTMTATGGATASGSTAGLNTTATASGTAPVGQSSGTGVTPAATTQQGRSFHVAATHARVKLHAGGHVAIQHGRSRHR